MNEQQLVEYLQSRAAVSVPQDFVGSVMAGVRTAPTQRSRFSSLLPAFAVAAVVAVVALLALVVGPGRDVGPAPSPSAATASPTATGEDELREAVTAATERLAQSAAVQGVQTSWTEEYIGTATWYDWRPNGDQVIVTRTDIDVQAPWYTDPDGEPLSVGKRITTDIQVLVGDSWYRTEDGEWVIEDRADAPPALSYPTGLLSAEILAVPPSGFPDDVTATRQALADGGEVWALEAVTDDGRSLVEWRIGADGVLVSFSFEGTGVNLAPGDSIGNRSIRSVTEFIPVSDPDPIPDPGPRPDPEQFGLPADFPLGAESSSGP